MICPTCTCFQHSIYCFLTIFTISSICRLFSSPPSNPSFPPFLGVIRKRTYKPTRRGGFLLSISHQKTPASSIKSHQLLKSLRPLPPPPFHTGEAHDLPSMPIRNAIQLHRCESLRCWPSIVVPAKNGWTNSLFAMT